MTTAQKTKSAFPSRVSDLPGNQRSLAKKFQPALAEAAREHGPLDLIRMLSAALGEEFATHPKPKAHLAMAQVRGLAAREELKGAEGGSLSAEEAGQRLGISKAAVLKRFQKGQILGWREARQKAVRLPLWQFTEDNVLDGLSEILKVFLDAPWIDDWGKIVFFLRPLSSMKGQRPLDLLRKGDTRRVVWAAQEMTE